MSLQVWLPLNGNLNNNGTANITVTNNGATIDNNGKIGKCYSFTGSPNRISIIEQLSYTYPLSISAWVYPTNATSSVTQYILSYNIDSQGTAGHIIGFGIYGGVLTVWCGGALYQHTALTNNTWYHIAITIDASKKYNLYLNGISVKSGTCGNAIASKWFTIGARSNSVTGGVGGADYYFQGKINDARLYDHALSEKEVKELSKGLIINYPLSFNDFGNENIMPNSITMSLGTASAELGRWRNAGSSTMTKSRVQILGNIYGFQNVGVQTPNDGSCYGIDAFPTEANTDYVISLYARLVSGTGGYAGFNVYNSTMLEGSWTKIDKNYRVTPLTTNWTRCWMHFKTNSSTTRNVYIGITTDSTEVTTQMFLVKIEKGTLPSPWKPKSTDEIQDPSGVKDILEYDISGNGYNGAINTPLLLNNNSARFKTSSVFNGTNNYIEADPLPTETKSISIWIKTTWKQSSGYRMAIHDKNTGLAIGWATQQLITYIGTANGSIGSRIDITTTNYTENKWNHIAVVKTGDTTRDVYVNGIKATPSGVNYWGGDLNKLNIGTRRLNGSYAAYFDGQLSDFRAYATALTADDVLELYKASNLL